ncbi:MAG: TIGR01777 family protein [Cytophagaceae bacterium]|nr:TIGR01777 family protein [Cytophagaceae bacterium]MBL0303003.1 TIGR01777 family protein [Cytophagaceae bacterium]MBL0325833.1 TIGR01777 family protein [Cytophagaceae bacterium]
MIILITGGGGLIGRALANKLQREGHEVRILSRSKRQSSDLKYFRWDYKNGFLEAGAMEDVEVLVHLAGEGIADKRWTQSRKREIIDSRVESLKFLQNFVPKTLKTLIGGSAIGYYGGDSGESENAEDSANGDDFMAHTCNLWEHTETEFAQNNNLRLAIIRTGVVLDKKGGALSKMALPVKYNFGSPLGTGKQWMSWIHIDDLVGMLYESIVNTKIEGVFNGVAPETLRNSDFTQTLANILSKKIWLPAVPSFLLKLILGEMSVVILGSSKVKNKRKILPSFQFPTLEKALSDIFNTK